MTEGDDIASSSSSTPAATSGAAGRSGGVVGGRAGRRPVPPSSDPRVDGVAPGRAGRAGGRTTQRNRGTRRVDDTDALRALGSLAGAVAPARPSPPDAAGRTVADPSGSTPFPPPVVPAAPTTLLDDPASPERTDHDGAVAGVALDRDRDADGGADEQVDGELHDVWSHPDVDTSDAAAASSGSRTGWLGRLGGRSRERARTPDAGQDAEEADGDGAAPSAAPLSDADATPIHIRATASMASDQPEAPDPAHASGVGAPVDAVSEAPAMPPSALLGAQGVAVASEPSTGQPLGTSPSVDARRGAAGRHGDVVLPPAEALAALITPDTAVPRPAPEPEPEPVLAPAPASRGTRALPVLFERRPRKRIRRVTRVVRHVDTWSVFKVALVFNLVLYVVCLTAGVLLWNVAYTTGTIDNIEQFFEQFGWSTFEFKGGEIYHHAWVGGSFAIVGLTGLAVLLATLFNLITDLVGGVRVSVLEEEVVARPATDPTVIRRRPKKEREERALEPLARLERDVAAGRVPTARRSAFRRAPSDDEGPGEIVR